MLSPLSFTIVVNVTKENARSVINKLPYADDLVIMSEIMEDLEGKMLKLEGCGKGVKVNIIKTKVMVSESEKLFKSKIDPCGAYGRRVIVNSVLCKKCGNWVHGRCAKIKKVTARLATRVVCSKCKRIM